MRAVNLEDQLVIDMQFKELFDVVRPVKDYTYFLDACRDTFVGSIPLHGMPCVTLSGMEGDRTNNVTKSFRSQLCITYKEEICPEHVFFLFKPVNLVDFCSGMQVLIISRFMV